MARRNELAFCHPSRPKQALALEGVRREEQLGATAGAWLAGLWASITLLGRPIRQGNQAWAFFSSPRQGRGTAGRGGQVPGGATELASVTNSISKAGERLRSG